MSRKRHSDEIEFGSDSFLDVVANIVGILIILIVVAGMKAGTAPVSCARLIEFMQKHSKAAPPTQAIKTPAPPERIVIPASPAIVKRAELLKAELTAIEQQDSAVAAGLETAQTREEELRRRFAEQQQSQRAEQERIKGEQQRLATERRRIEVLRTGLQQVEVDVQQAEAKKPPTKAIRHRLTPLSRDVQGKEIHFRIADNKVCYLPINELLERLRPQILRQKERLARNGSQHGRVGPVRGFTMEYVAEIQSASIVDELRSGMVSVGVRQWHLVAESDLEAETLEQALKSQSNFLRALNDAEPETTVTFWVYPDSFGLYQRLQEVAHKENFSVAGRPLPFGVPIAGSPQGMRSSGQ